MQLLRSENGADLDQWEVVVGDGLYHAPSEAPVNPSDIATISSGSASAVRANISNRRIMAHNITFKRIIDTSALTSYQEAGYQFRLPYTISTGNTDYNGQTVEGGLFIWDGQNTQLDYGLAFQWVINPWDPAFKTINYWAGTGWQPLTVLEPDTNYHTVGYKLDMVGKTAWLILDGTQYPQNIFSETPKTGWGIEVASRFQAETISIFPSSVGSVPGQEVSFKNWNWDWYQSGSV